MTVTTSAGTTSSGTSAETTDQFTHRVVLADQSLQTAARVRSSAMVRQPPQIVLTWLTRLRWIAIAGQVLAVVVAMVGLGMPLPLLPIVFLIAATTATNALLTYWIVNEFATHETVVPAILLFDVAVLTGLLSVTGGVSNPFCVLYLVHVAMAVAVASSVWTWVIVTFIALAYGSQFFIFVPLPVVRDDARWMFAVGGWMSLVLAAVLVAYFIGNIRDELRRRDLELSSMRELIHRNDRLTGLTTLAAGAAHELGTPLGTIAVVAREIELAAKNADADAGIVDDARLIRSQVDRCRSILDRMKVEQSQLADEPPAPVRVSELYTLLCSHLPAQRSQRLVLAEASVNEPLILPQKMLCQALGLLIDNAFDASGDTDPVTLAVSHTGIGYRFIVTDRGQGMDEQVMAHLGEPFFTTKPPGRGMGLGLLLVRLVAERLGGTLRLESSAGKGCRAVLEIAHAGGDAENMR